MKLSSIVTAAALFGSLVVAAPASAQSGVGTGLGDARQRDLPSTYSLNEGRSYYGYRRFYGPRPFYRARPFYRPYYRPRPRFYRYGY